VRNEPLSAVLDELAAAGVNDRQVIRRGKHMAVIWTAQGREHSTFLAVTPSDRSAALNCRAVVRRQLRAIK